MKIVCDRCGKAVEDSLLQIEQAEGGEILYLCPECYLSAQPPPPEEQP
jgi:ribosome-binding protein aMBF1 (putative translation factor)